MANQVSWLLVEPGWRAVSGSGETLGEVAEVVGDPNADIFDGLRLKVGDGRRYVPAERVTSIVEGEVRLDADTTELDQLDAGEQPRGGEVHRNRSAGG
jgi:hypothetical protein